jgi:hypothetical protein
MNKAPLITAVRVTDRLKLEIAWNTGELLGADLTETVNQISAFKLLANSAIFNQVKIEEWGHGLDWPEGVDMGADRLYHLCREQAGLFSPITFNEWMNNNQLSLASAAEALGMTRRMIAHYRSGSRPIPKTIQLACIGWESLKKAA